MSESALFAVDGSPTYEARPGRHRRDDHHTSVEGARSVAFRAGSQKAKLLAVYASGDYTDERAAEAAGLLRSCYWKRCGELREDGLIVDTGRTETGDAGVARIVSTITERGREALRSI